MTPSPLIPQDELKREIVVNRVIEENGQDYAVIHVAELVRLVAHPGIEQRIVAGLERELREADSGNCDACAKMLKRLIGIVRCAFAEPQNHDGVEAEGLTAPHSGQVGNAVASPDIRSALNMAYHLLKLRYGEQDESAVVLLVDQVIAAYTRQPPADPKHILDRA